MKYYLAYGSNLNTAQMALRCPDARLFGVGYLNNYELIFHGSRGNAHASIREKKGSKVPVAVWMISDRDERSLDCYEGFPRYYFKKDVDVVINGSAVTTMVYIMDEARGVNKPSPYYVDVIREGYSDMGMDPEYLDKALKKNKREYEKAAG